MTNGEIIKQCQNMALLSATENLEELKEIAEKCKNEKVPLILKKESALQVERCTDKIKVRVVIQKKLVNQVSELVYKQEGSVEKKLVTLSYANFNEYKSWVVVMGKILLIVFCGAVICAIQKFIQSTS